MSLDTATGVGASRSERTSQVQKEAGLGGVGLVAACDALEAELVAGTVTLAGEDVNAAVEAGLERHCGEPARRPRYSELVLSGFPEGIAADDGVGLHYIGTKLEQVVACRPNATAYRVTAAGAEPLAATVL